MTPTGAADFRLTAGVCDCPASAFSEISSFKTTSRLQVTPSVSEHYHRNAAMQEFCFKQ
jgi:hypothetical protein